MIYTFIAKFDVGPTTVGIVFAIVLNKFSWDTIGMWSAIFKFGLHPTTHCCVVCNCVIPANRKSLIIGVKVARPFFNFLCQNFSSKLLGNFFIFVFQIVFKISFFSFFFKCFSIFCPYVSKFLYTVRFWPLPYRRAGWWDIRLHIRSWNGRRKRHASHYRDSQYFSQSPSRNRNPHFSWRAVFEIVTFKSLKNTNI